MYSPADLLERVRQLLVRKRGPRRLHQRQQQPAMASHVGV
jgi:hypothetical protein